MTLQRLPEIVYPLTQVNKVNEIVDILNENLNMYYSEENPLLTSVEGSCTWVVTHNLGTENVNCSLYNGDNFVISTVSITSANIVTVSLNSSSNIAAGTYKIVIISNGAGGSSGGSSYVLPTASTTTLGGVKIDGTSITIDDGVISATATPITVDSTLSSSSTNPVQNKVLYPSLSEFLPANTEINIKVDGSGDFPDLNSAIDYLTGKWSNGEVKIILGVGTYDITSAITINGSKFSIPRISISGTDVSTTILRSRLTASEHFLSVIAGAQVDFTKLTFKHISGSSSANYYGINLAQKSFVRFTGTNNFQGLSRGICINSSSEVYAAGTLNFTNCNDAIVIFGGILGTSWGTTLNFDTCTTGIYISCGGQVKGFGTTVNKTNVTTPSNITGNLPTADGWISGLTI